MAEPREGSFENRSISSGDDAHGEFWCSFCSFKTMHRVRVRPTELSHQWLVRSASERNGRVDSRSLSEQLNNAQRRESV